MKSIATETKVGIFVVLGILVLTYFTVRVGKISVREEGYRVYTYVDSAAGLDKNSPVRIAGVEVGKVESISLEGAEGQGDHAPPRQVPDPRRVEALREILRPSGRKIHRDRPRDRAPR